MNTQKNETKKPYVKPTVTDHGTVREETQGIVGDYWEVYGTTSYIEKPKF